jgi:hypothetical protein
LRQESKGGKNKEIRSSYYNEASTRGVMLPINHTWAASSLTHLSETAPQMDVAIHDSEPLGEELRAYPALDSSLWPRRAPREAAHTSLQGWLAPLPRQSSEPMVLAVEGVAPKAVRAMPSFLSEGTWNAERVLHQPWQAVETALGAADGVLLVDGRDCPKQGRHSAGVKRH